jgi:transcriptional regulator with XRE-family HTH domain
LDQVANSAGVSRASLWEIEHGRIKATLEHAEKIAGAFGYGLIEALAEAVKGFQEPRAYEVAIQEALAMAERCAAVLKRELSEP